MPWRIEYDGHSLREGDITLAQAEQIETMTGVSWLRLNPIASAKHARAVLAVLYAAATDVAVDVVNEKIGAIPVPEFIEMVHVDDEDLPSEYVDGFPQSADGPSTST